MKVVLLGKHSVSHVTLPKEIYGQAGCLRLEKAVAVEGRSILKRTKPLDYQKE